jgi:Ca2+-binding RTX toxin-like protein
MAQQSQFIQTLAGTTNMPVFTNDQISNQLINNGLTPGGTATPKFNVAPGGSLSVNITGMTADGQAMIRAALAVWSDATGITFNEVTTGQKITFDDTAAGASTVSRTTALGFSTTATVNFASSITPGTSLNSDAYQIYVREIGRALGLNPAALYDSTPTFDERSYDNDSRHNSVMSLFTQADNTILTDSNATVMGPMIADLLAIQTIYGPVTTTRTGDTTYGFNSNAGRAQYDASLYASVSYVVFDNGGNDTLNYSGFTQNQTISLVAETFSNVGGLVGNVGIARGSVIENAIGGEGADTITGNAANNILDGGVDTVSDTLIGGAGDDSFYVRTTSDVVVEVLSGGADTVFAQVTHSLSANADVEVLRATDANSTNAMNLSGSSVAQTIIGNNGANILRGFAGADLILGNAGSDAIEGGTGIDTMDGGTGSDTYYADESADLIIESTADLAIGGYDTVNFNGTSGTFVLGANIERLNLTGSFAINGTGNELNNLMFGNAASNVIVGNEGHDIIDGAGGSDFMFGGIGDDTYYVNLTTDSITESNLSVAIGGLDTVYFNGTSGTYILNTYIENMVLAGTSAISVIGNSSKNSLTGNNGSNTLSGLGGTDTINGGAGADTMLGGDASDTYYADRIDDIVTETNANVLTGGTDLVYFTGTTGTFVLTSNVENLTIQGNSAVGGTGNILDNMLIGNGAANTLSGLGGNDFIDGGLGSDTMIGGDGNDTYVVNVVADIVTETNNNSAIGGFDLVQFSGTTGTYTLGANVEGLTLIGAAAISGIGNETNNALLGNSAANTLSGLDGGDTIDGGAGIDTMIGGNGNDLYFANLATDIVTETNADVAIGGFDKVFFNGTSGTYILTAHVEELELQGTAAINGTGNDLNNFITGNNKANVLNGGLGIDVMHGYDGSDTYTADVENDTIVEFTSDLLQGGDDLVNFTGTTGTFVLTSNIERLTLRGTDAINGIGNALANTLYGNGAANTLQGLGGNDTINAGAGIDTMIGGDGNDTYFADVADDIITESNSALLTGGNDTIWYSGASGTTFALGNNVENLRVNGSANSNATGNELANFITGGTGVNILSGLAGNDIISGGYGNDTLSGGSDADTFLFNAALATTLNKDTILDFSVTDDSIQLENAIFTALTTTGALDASMFKNTTTGVIDADDRILYNATTGVISYDVDGNGIVREVEFAVLTASPTITVADFFVI